jgi:hypothetical protein
MLLIGLAGCGSTEPASAPATESATPTPTPETPLAAPTPHQGVIAVVDVVQVPSRETGLRVFAMLLRGDVGTSAVRRSLEIRARMEPIDGSSCGTPPVPMVLRPTHADAVQPVLADRTRAVVVRSLGRAEPLEGPGSSASFRYGPVPSLNGDFEGWVSFHFPADAADGFCAFDVRGVVVIIAGETTSAELPVVRVDTRVRLDGSQGWARSAPVGLASPSLPAQAVGRP